MAECDERCAYISGFTGSAGLAVVSLHAAALFTDGRYFLQASQQLDPNWTLMKSGLPDVPTWQEYLVKVLLDRWDPGQLDHPEWRASAVNPRG